MSLRRINEITEQIREQLKQSYFQQYTGELTFKIHCSDGSPSMRDDEPRKTGVTFEF